MRKNNKKNEDSEQWTSSFSFQFHLHFFRRMHINSLFGRKSFDCHKDNICFSLVLFRFTWAQWAVRVLSFSIVFTRTSHEEVLHNSGDFLLFEEDSTNKDRLAEDIPCYGLIELKHEGFWLTSLLAKNNLRSRGKLRDSAISAIAIKQKEIYWQKCRCF